ncbi:DEKNAAC104062 [Brettanomyces naardenensis]|uniref:DEKNAAC104062 n=1 Tax=Brettanomyces naardenensis TaxID=13370 RepID=A0A448YQ92_BRENA|nr:DEKNAAC104062 [Brettanomyces naardenensis]
MFSLVARSSRAPLRNVRLFHVSSLRSNLVQNLYLQELKAFKPTPLTAADAEAATQPWKLPAAAKAPALEDEGADALSEYDSSAVEVASAKPVEGAAEESYNPDDWFVLEEDDIAA